VFGQPKNGVMWPVLLEKAMAKFVGSYAWISGGTEPYALTALSGMPLCYCIARPSTDESGTEARVGSWMWCGAQYVSRDVTGMGYAGIRCDLPVLDDENMWSRLMLFEARNYVMTASITHFKTPNSQKGYFRRDGLVLGHAYSLLTFKTVRVQSGGDVRESLDWIDLDGDCIGFERVGEHIYNTCNGSRWQASGVQDTVHLVALTVDEVNQSFVGTDTMGTSFTGFIPRDKCAAVLKMWAAREDSVKHPFQEPELLSPGTRVRFKGLKKAVELNGRLGEVLGRKSEGDDPPYVVRLIIDIGVYDVGTLADEYNYWEALAKRKNLEVVPGVPGARGGAVRLVLLRNPHGEGEIVPTDGIHCTKWRGDWSDNAKLWEMYPDVASQLNYTPANDGRFWMTFEDFRRTFDKVCVLTKSMKPPNTSTTFELPTSLRADRGREVPLSLVRMSAQCPPAPGTPSLLQQLELAEIKFDPFARFPSFLDDGSIDARLRWEACKPGRLSEFMKTSESQGNLSGVQFLRKRVQELGLEQAIGPTNHI